MDPETRAIYEAHASEWERRRQPRNVESARSLRDRSAGPSIDLGCGPGWYAPELIAPVVAPTNPNVPVPVGNTGLIEIPVHIPGFAGQTLPFTAQLDNKPWLVRVHLKGTSLGLQIGAS